MLTGEELGRALGQAIDKKNVSKAEVARHFGVKPPSVQDWIKYGRVSKKHLDKMFKYFSDVVGPEHWGIESRKTPPADIPIVFPLAVKEPKPGKYDLELSELSPAEQEVIIQIRKIKPELQPAALQAIQSVLSAFATANKATTHASAGDGLKSREGGGGKKPLKKT